MSVSGHAQLNSALKRIEGQLKGGIGDVVKKTAHGIEKEAKQNIERNNSIDTGHMLRSVQTQMNGTEEAEVVVPVEYAHYVEFGTSRRGPKPFFFPAVYNGEKAFLQNLQALGSKLK